MKKILVPIDFSLASRNASEYAAVLANVFAAEVHLIYVYLEPGPAAGTPVVWIISGSVLQEENEVRVQKEVDYLKQKHTIKVTGEAKFGKVGDVINEVGKEIRADLIVMGMKGGNRSKILGSTVLATIRKTRIPVLAVPEAAAYIPIKRIVLASDFNWISDASLWNTLFKIIEKFDASLQVVHVQKKGVEMAVSEFPGKLQLNRELSKITYLYDEIEDDDVVHGLHRFIQGHPADLLVVVAHRHTIFERAFGTVHTRSISFTMKLPLLVLED